MYRPKLQSVALAVTEIIAVYAVYVMSPQTVVGHQQAAKGDERCRPTIVASVDRA